MKLTAIAGLVPAIICLAAGCNGRQGDWSKEEREIINGRDEVLRVLTVDNREDSTLLRDDSVWLSDEDLRSPEFETLSRKLVATVTSPEQDGVGIAGPQVGILRRIVAVQRFDKPGEPFEVYPNIAITGTYGDKVPGGEGCLSVPGYRGIVSRYRDIEIKYTVPGTLTDTTERISGFTAVIFQHETDHLSGILYTDKADSLGIR